MKRISIIAVVVLIVIAFSTCVSQKTKKTVSLPKYKSVFIGWIDLNEKDWLRFNYANKEDWNRDAKRIVFTFLRNCEYKLSCGEVHVAQNESDTDFGKADLYIKFTDAFVDWDNYYLYMTIHFIETAGNNEVYVLKKGKFYGNAAGFTNYLNAAMTSIMDFINSKLNQ
jgi:hypothetical protein